MATPGGQNLTGPSDGGASGMPMVNQDALFEDLPKEMLRLFKEVETYVDKISKEWSKTVKETTDAIGDVEKNKPGAGRLGLGSMSRSEKIGVGLGLATVAASTYMAMAPNTMAAVTQRMAADSFAGVSGMSSRQAILQANKQVGGGSTSAYGPTMAAMNIAYSGYTANSLSSRNIMGSIAGMSAQSGMTNEAAAASVAGMNGMSFLRAGIRIRDSKGNLKPIAQIINDVYNFLYRGRQISSEEAQLVYNSGSRAFSTIQILAGGDPGLMQQIQAGIVARARAKSSKAYSNAMNSKDPNKMLDILGVDKSSPIRANFRYQSSETKKLGATEQGLVGGYDASLRTTASLNDAYSKMADLLGPVNDGLMTLKGILQTMPGAGGMGATISGITGSVIGGVAQHIGGKMAGKFMQSSMGKGLESAGGSLLKTAGKSIWSKVWSIAKNPKNWGKAAVLAGEEALVAGEEVGTAGLATPAAIAEEAAIAAQAAAMFKGGPSASVNVGMAGGDGSGGTPQPTASPSTAKVSSGYGMRTGNSMLSGMHPGIDFADKLGTPVRAWSAGVVSHIGNEANGYGNWIEINHGNGLATRYAHLKTIMVSRGDKVKTGQVIAKSGSTGKSTGPHLHFEVLVNGKKVDPTSYLNGKVAKGTSVSPESGVKYHFTGSRARQKVTPMSPGGLSSASVSNLISQLSTSGSPVSWQDVVKKLPKKDAEKYINSIPDAYTGPVTHDKKSLIKNISANGFHGDALRTAYAVAIAESGGRSNAMGDVGLQDNKWGPSVGLFQIRSLKDWKKYNDPYRDASRLPNPEYNVKAAFVKSNHGKSFKAWSTFTSGAFVKHLSEADTLAKQTGVGGPSESVNLPSNFSGHQTNQQIVVAGGRSHTGTVNVNLHMNVTISHGSVQEAERIVKLVGERLKNDHTLRQIASSL